MTGFENVIFDVQPKDGKIFIYACILNSGSWMNGFCEQCWLKKIKEFLYRKIWKQKTMHRKHSEEKFIYDMNCFLYITCTKFRKITIHWYYQKG